MFYLSTCDKLKEEEISNGTLFVGSALQLSAPRWRFRLPGQMCVIVFPALTLPRVSTACYRCLGSFSISDKRSDLRLEILKAFLDMKL